MAPIDRVQLRDGRLVSFDSERIVDAVLDAMAEAGDGNVELAEELGSAVSHFLESRADRGAPSPDGLVVIPLDQIHDMVEKVLMETGHRSVARAYILRRDRRARIRDRSPRRKVATEGIPHVRDRFDGESSPWSRERISRVLMEEGDLDGADAEEVSTAVEERVLRSGQQIVTTALIRELVDSELFERGFTKSLAQQSSVAIPKHDLEKLLYRGGDPTRDLFPGGAEHTSRSVGDMILRQYVLEHVYDADQRSAFRRGDLHIHQIQHSLLLLRLPILADQLGSSGGESVFERLFSVLAGVRSSVAEEIEVFRLAEALGEERRRLRDRQDDADSPARAARDLIRGLETLRGTTDTTWRGPTMTLRVPCSPQFAASGESAGLFATGMGSEEEIALFAVETLRHALLDPGGSRALAGVALKLELTLRTFEDRRFREALHSIVTGLSGETPLFFCIESSHPSGNSRLSQAEFESALLAGKITLNLPRIAAEARHEGEEGIEALLAKRLGLIRRAFRARDAFVSKLALHPDGALARVREVIGSAESFAGSSANFGYAIGILGLEECVRNLTGCSLHENELARRRGLELIESIAGLLLALREDDDPEIFLEESVNRGVLRKLESEDRKKYPESFLDTPKGGALYTSGVRLARRAPVDPLEAWTLTEEFRPHMRLASRLDETTRLRSEGPEVLLAFLEEVCRMRATPAAVHLEPYRYDRSRGRS